MHAFTGAARSSAALFVMRLRLKESCIASPTAHRGGCATLRPDHDMLKALCSDSSDASEVYATSMSAKTRSRLDTVSLAATHESIPRPTPTYTHPDLALMKEQRILIQFPVAPHIQPLGLRPAQLQHVLIMRPRPAAPKTR